MSEIGAFHIVEHGKSRTKFKMLSGDINWKEYGGKFVTKKLNNGDFDYWIVMDVINMHDATGDESIDKYTIELLAISPSQVSQEDLNCAFSCIGIENMSQEDLNNPMIQVEALVEYGIFAMLWSNSGNNLKKLLVEAHAQADLIQSLFGFYMDRCENRIGSTGWDCIAGDLMRPIREYKE